MAKPRVAVLFGGVSGEHEISCISGATIADHIDTDKYEVFKLGITKKGRWLLYPGETGMMRDGSWDTCPGNVPAFISPDRALRGVVLDRGGVFDVVGLDMVFPALHGIGGEDGTVQGLLELAGIPYVGCGVLASATCMDKSAANLVFEARGIPHTPWMVVEREALEDIDLLFSRLRGRITFPIIAKPARGGSSLGVTKAHDAGQLRAAIRAAGAHDRRVLLESAVDGQEVECAVIGNAAPHSTLPGEVVSCNEIYDYEAKYRSGDASRLYLPARLPPAKLEEVRALAERAFSALGCEGLARADFFVERGSGRVLVSELNTMPGFTSISMYSKLMAHEGTGFTPLIDRLILLARERFEA
jgi:D-alanine-D-alanine ligase